MDDRRTDPAGPRPAGRRGRTDGGVHFEETVGLSNSSYAGLSRAAFAIALVAVLGTVLVVPLALVAFFGLVLLVSGNAIGDLGGVVGSVVSFPSLLFTAVFTLFVVAAIVAGVVMVAKRSKDGDGGGLSLGRRDEIHTRVTDSAVEVDREGGYIGQSSGVTIPFETVTTVEYNDPDGDLRLELGDVRAKKFIGGRSGDWVRIGRSDGPAVYVGSDQHRQLAEVIAGLSPHVDGARPFS